MGFDFTKAFEAGSGFIVVDGAGVFSGAVSPVGFDAPLGSLYLLNGATEQLWQKTSTGINGWTLRIFANQGSTGVTPPFTFSKAGNAGPGTYLRTGESVTSNTGQIVKGSNTISQISASNGSVVGSTTRIQLQRRTAVDTFVDVASAFIDIIAGQYAATNSSLSVSWGPDWEMSAYVKSGVSLDNPVLVVYMIPA